MSVLGGEKSIIKQKKQFFTDKYNSLFKKSVEK